MDPTGEMTQDAVTQFTLPETNLAEDQFAERKRRSIEFLERDNGENADMAQLRQIIRTAQPRLVVSIDHLREFDAEFAAHLVAEPSEFIPALEDAAKQIAVRLAGAENVVIADLKTYRVAVGFQGSFGAHHVTPRGLRARLLGQLVCIEGIVTRCSLVRPKVVRSVHYSEAAKTFYAKAYQDATTSAGGSNSGFSSAYPTADDKGQPLTTEFGYSQYMDHQTVNVQEMPERAPPGQLPRGVDVIMDDDLVDAVKPGDRVTLVGVYRALGGKAMTAASAIFRTVVVVGSVQVFGAGSLAAAGGSSSTTISARELASRAQATGQ
ncbi:MCM DNA helicase complex subunit, partial [Linderina macrospora]